MVNVILPLKEDFEEAKKLIKSQSRKQVTFFVGITNADKGKIKNSKTVKVFVYQDGSAKEEMINSLSHEVGEGKIIILRKVISADEFQKFVESNSDITICASKKMNGFCKFFYEIWKRIVHFLFGFNFFDGDVSVVAFNENTSMVASSLKNLSHVSRIDRWKGCSVSTVEMEGKPAEKEYDKVATYLTFFAFIALFLGVIAGAAVYFVLCKATFLTGFLWACAMLVSLLALAINVIIFVLNLKTGKRRFGEAKKEETK